MNRYNKKMPLLKFKCQQKSAYYCKHIKQIKCMRGGRKKFNSLYVEAVKYSIK